MLFICPTPIGNLSDITLRVIDVLKQVDLIAAEDTRRTGKLLKHLEISKPLVSFFEHNEPRRLPELIGALRQGKEIALVSDAGMPGICDPGHTLIKAALDEGLEVEVLPGPSAIETALVSSGFASASFTFLGYLPKKKGELIKVLEKIGREEITCIAFESPHRLAATLDEAATIQGIARIAICRELTKKFEEIRRGTAAEIRGSLPEKVKGEIVLVFEPATEKESAGAPDANMLRVLEELLDEGFSSKRASELIASITDVPKNLLYEMALEIKRKKG